MPYGNIGENMNKARLAEAGRGIIQEKSRSVFCVNSGRTIGDFFVFSNSGDKER